MNNTGLYCTNCNQEFEEGEGVLLVSVGTVAEESFDHYHYYCDPGDGPYLHQLCCRCAPALQAEKQRPNRVVVEVHSGMVQAVRAERPDEVMVIVYASTGLLLTFGRPGGEPIGPLNTVAAPIVSNSIEVMERLAENERGTCLTCGELVPEGCCTCGPRRKLG